MVLASGAPAVVSVSLLRDRSCRTQNAAKNSRYPLSNLEYYDIIESICPLSGRPLDTS